MDSTMWDLASKAWTAATSDEVANFCQVGMLCFAGFAALEYFHGRREKRKADIAERVAEEENQRMEQEEKYTRLQDEFREEQQWFQSQKNFIQLSVADDELKNRLVDDTLKVHHANLLSLFEQSFILLYHPDDKDYARFWHSWDDYISETLADKDFFKSLPGLLDGEDPQFIAYMRQKVKDFEAQKTAPKTQAVSRSGSPAPL